jgi:hypothetical protein
VPTPLDLTNIEDKVAVAMLKAGFEPQIIYAYKMTGLIGMAGATDNWPPDRREEWGPRSTNISPSKTRPSTQVRLSRSPVTD